MSLVLIRSARPHPAAARRLGHRIHNKYISVAPNEWWNMLRHETYLSVT